MFDEEKFIEKNTYPLEAFLSICQADRPKKGRQWLEYTNDSNSYTVRDKIHVGLKTIDLKELKTADDDDKEYLYTIISQYLLEHEDQHNRSTRDKDFVAAQQRFFYRILEEISKLFKDNFVFRNIPDYDRYIKQLNDNGYNLNRSFIEQLGHFVTNAIEDARIERIRSYKRPGFAQKNILIRTTMWMEDNDLSELFSKYGSYDEINAKDKLLVIVKAIHILATLKIYPKDFEELFDKTELFDTVNDCKVDIINAVKSKNCRGIVKPVENIAVKIAKFVFDTIEKNESDDAQSDLENEMQKNGMSGESSSEYTCKAQEEEEEEGIPDDMLKWNDLEDEDSDENASNGKQSEDSNEPENSEDGENSEDDDAAENYEDGDNGKEAENQNGEGNSKKSKKSDKEGNADGNEEGNASDNDIQSDDMDNEDSEEENDDSNSSNKGSDSKPSPIDLKLTHGQDDHGKAHKGEDTIKMIKEAMEKAAKSAMGDYEIAKKQANSQQARMNSTRNKLEDTPPYVPQDLNLANRFMEMKRAYDLNSLMPFALQNRSDKFAEDVEELFQNQEVPLVRCQKNGKIDPTNIYKLGINSIDCFSKEMDAPEFDGCCYMLIDNSGSMGYGHGSRRYFACSAVAVMERGFSKHMPMKIAAYDENGKIYHEVIKDWGEELESSGAYNFMIKGRRGGGTPTGESITIATEELLARSEDEKMLIILTDGYPNDNSLCKHAIEEASNCGINVVTIFFDGHAEYLEQLKEQNAKPSVIADVERQMEENRKKLTSVFGKNSIFCSPDETEGKLASLLEDFVFN